MAVSFYTRPLAQSPPSSSHSAFRADIEGLRALAILLVVGYHVDIPGITGGFIGVDVFFVLSGYLITSLIVKEIAEQGKLDLPGFYARRARRLLPAAALMLLVTLIASTFVLSPIELVTLSESAVATSVYLSNMWFMSSASDYFGASSQSNPLLHTWSLAVEEQFYLVWPVIVMLALGGAGSPRRLRIVMVALTAISFAACVWMTRDFQPVAFYGAPLRAWEFGAGALASMIHIRERDAWMTPVGWLGLIAVVATGFLYSWYTPFPGYMALVPVLGTAAILVSCARPKESGLKRLLGARLFQIIGRLSYSWYLWHWPVLIIAEAAFPGMSLLARIGCALGSLGLACLTHFLFENPIRFNPFLARRVAMTGAMALLLLAIGIGGSAATRFAAARGAASPQQQAYASAVNDFTRLYDTGCIVPATQAEIRECTFGNSSSSTTIVLFGDSHAVQWFPTLEAIARSADWRLISLVKNACPTADVVIRNSSLKREYHECAEWRKSAVARIVELQPSAVILGNSAGYAMPGSYAGLAYEQWRTGHRRTLEVFEEHAIRSFLIRDTPRPGTHVPVCLSRADYQRFGMSEECTVDRGIAVSDDVFKAEREAAFSLEYATLLDFTDLFCAEGSCAPVVDGIVVYRDTNHITSAFAEHIAPAVGARIRQLLLDPVSAAAYTRGKHVASNESPATGYGR